MKSLIVIMLSTLLITACGSGNESSNGDSIKITNMSPKQSMSLEIGETIMLSYEVEYELKSSESGFITLVVQGASNETIVNESYIAEQGKHTETLKAEIVVPDTRAIQVFTPLLTPASTSTTVVDSRTYQVVK